MSSGNLERGLGTFQGGWFSETGEAEGAVRGRWVAGGERGGYFSGIWCSTCPVQDGLGGNGNDDDTGNTGNEGDDADDAGGNADDVGGSDGGGNGGDIGGANGGGNGGDAGGSGGGN